MRVLVLAALLAVACTPNYTSKDKDACTALADAQCTKLDACERDGVVNAYGDEATCRARLLAACKATFEASHTSAEASFVETCAVSLGDASCGDFEFGTLDACAALPGSGASGQPCAFSAQCATGFCALAANGACGTCQPFATAGADCSTTICSPGFACSASKQCVPYGAPGADCNENEPCAFAVTCVTPSGAMNGTCVVDALDLGANCDPAHVTNPDCDGHLGLTCDPATDKCIALTYATAGQPCGNVSGTIVACSKQSSCVNGACVAFAADGVSCNATTVCTPPASCANGACALPDASICK